MQDFEEHSRELEARAPAWHLRVGVSVVGVLTLGVGVFVVLA